MSHILTSIIVGAAAGWAAGCLMKRQQSWIFNIVLGICGGSFGPWLLGFLNIETTGSFWSSLLSSIVGAVALIFIARLIFKKGK
ncbi:MAG: GlsB/YeaQ/YmgE family stress response membrane protein [Flavobacteriales bacterium]